MVYILRAHRGSHVAAPYIYIHIYIYTPYSYMDPLGNNLGVQVWDFGFRLIVWEFGLRV